MSDQVQDHFESLRQLKPSDMLGHRIMNEPGQGVRQVPERRNHKQVIVGATAAAAALVFSGFFWMSHQTVSAPVHEVVASSTRSLVTKPSGAVAPNVEGGIGAHGEPFLNAKKYLSIAEAQAASESKLSLPRPDDPLASDDDVSDVWLADAGGEPQVRIDYDSGIYVEIEVAPPSLASETATAEAYQQMAAEDAFSTNGQAVATQVLGVPAYLIPSDAAVYANGESQKAPGYIEFVVDGRTVDIVGHVSTDALKQLAASVIASAPDSGP
jgi:hypothetical protein